jgi:hypothetical protein
MSARARLDAMRPSRPGPTRTADPRPPDHFPTRGNYLPYLAFGAAGALLGVIGLGILHTVWVLGDHDPAAWRAHFAWLGRPGLLIFHAFALLVVTWFAFRLFRMFPKTQPQRIGPLKRPPDAFFLAALGAAFLVATVLASLVLGGAFL